MDGPAEAAVAALVKSANVDFVITTGDNNYDIGAAVDVDPNVGKHYSAFIGNYMGMFQPGSVENRFFPSLGNHDWYTPNAQPYLDYFTLPGNERYYDFRRGPAHFFSIDSDPNEPDGFLPGSIQAMWLKNALAASTAPFKFVYFHHGAYSSAVHGDNIWMQWPFAEWGATAVFAGHDHSYERSVINGFPYIVNGLGGRSLYAFRHPISGSQKRFNSDFGAMFCDVDKYSFDYRFITRTGAVVDSNTIPANYQYFDETILLPAGSTWKYLDNGTNQGTAWRQPAFDDSGWAQGNAQFGYGEGDESTTVSFGGNPSNKFITTYFRKNFTVNNPAAFRELNLKVLRDDGVVIYINGTEVFRSNMPGGPVGYLTNASSSVADLQEFSHYGDIIPASLLVAGGNTIAVEVHQVDADSSDLSFNLQLTGRSGDTLVIPKGSVWKYCDQEGPVASGWNAAGFDDSAWSQGPAQLGYGDGDEATILQSGSLAGEKNLTAWFRREFFIQNVESIKNLVARILRDDGCIVYLNGHEVHRSNMPATIVDHLTLSSFGVAGTEENQFTETWLDPRWLVNGRNVLAVEVHQSTPASSDLSFDLELFSFR